MMREEFETLTGVTVSLTYYTEVIEPEYCNNSIDKQTFCAQWKKNNKSNLITCIGTDFHEQARTVITNKAKFEQLDRDLTKSFEKCRATEREKEELIREVKELGRMVDANAEVIEEKELEIEQLKAATQTEMQAQLKAKDLEIMQLKAKLYDMLNNIPA